MSVMIDDVKQVQAPWCRSMWQNELHNDVPVCTIADMCPSFSPGTVLVLFSLSVRQLARLHAPPADHVVEPSTMILELLARQTTPLLL